MTFSCDILGIGALSVDDFLSLDHHPAPDTKQPVRATKREGGGLCATALVAAQRLGARTAFVGVLGHDELSRFSLDALESEGVDCSRVRRQDGARPRHSTILVDNATGGRCILSSKDGVVPVPPEAVRPEWLDGCRVLFVDHTEPQAGIVAAELARACGVPIVADIERVNEPGALDLMRLVTHLIVGLAFARRLTGEDEPAAVLRALQNDWCDNAVVLCATDGADGCHALCENEVRHVPAFAVEAIDTTGCGDAFHGAYAVGLARGDDLETRLRWASACAALNATQMGGRGGLPTRAQVAAFLSQRTA